jgi:hypothetical protein
MGGFMSIMQSNSSNSSLVIDKATLIRSLNQLSEEQKVVLLKQFADITSDSDLKRVVAALPQGVLAQIGSKVDAGAGAAAGKKSFK